MVAVVEQPEPMKATANSNAVTINIFPFNSNLLFCVLNCITLTEVYTGLNAHASFSDICK
jgi:hypothetical protein